MSTTGIAARGQKIPLRAAIPAAVLAVASGVAIVFGGSIDSDQAQCGPGFSAEGAHCFARGAPCPSPLVLTDHGCDAPLTRIAIPESTISVGPSDWEAEGRVPARKIHVGAFSLDAFEVTVGAFACPTCPFPDPVRYERSKGDLARAIDSVSRDEAVRFCTSRGGRLPTEDEWIVAATGDPPRRYPWGDTGAVCRRAAWGLAVGPCSRKGEGPDTVGAHPEGATASGVHDMAGNVAEWVDATGTPGSKDGARGIVRGGSWKTVLVTDLRTWARLDVDPAAKDTGLGVRCAYTRLDVSGRGAGRGADGGGAESP